MPRHPGRPGLLILTLLFVTLNTALAQPRRPGLRDGAGRRAESAILSLLTGPDRCHLQALNVASDSIDPV